MFKPNDHLIILITKKTNIYRSPLASSTSHFLQSVQKRKDNIFTDEEATPQCINSYSAGNILFKTQTIKHIINYTLFITNIRIIFLFRF